MVFNEFKRLSKSGRHIEDIAQTLARQHVSPMSEVATEENEVPSNEHLLDLVKQMSGKINDLENQNKLLLERSEKQEKFNEELLKRLNEQNQFISNRDESMMIAMRDIQETKELISSASEEKKKGFWERLFRG